MSAIHVLPSTRIALSVSEVTWRNDFENTLSICPLAIFHSGGGLGLAHFGLAETYTGNPAPGEVEFLYRVGLALRRLQIFSHARRVGVASIGKLLHRASLLKQLLSLDLRVNTYDRIFYDSFGRVI